MLKLQLKLSSSGVSLNSLAIRRSWSTPRLRSSVSLRPFRSVSSRISLSSFSLPALASSAILSMMASTVVVGGIWVISIMFSPGTERHRARTLTLPRPVSKISRIWAAS